MKPWRTILASTLLSLACLSAASQVSVDHYRGDGMRYVRSCEEVMYDNYFHTARFAVAAVVNDAGMASFSLEVTFDEGMLHVSQGDSLTLVLRGGARIVLKTDRDVTKGDILKRHYRSRNDYYVTCHYPLSNYDIQRLTRNRTTKISMQTDRFTFDRKVDKFQERFRKQFTELYRFLMEGRK